MAEGATKPDCGPSSAGAANECGAEPGAVGELASGTTGRVPVGAGTLHPRHLNGVASERHGEHAAASADTRLVAQAPVRDSVSAIAAPLSKNGDLQRK